jgi:hypothetical protein
MPALILYLLKINIALVLFYLAYRFALRRLTFYTLNRFFLVSAIVFSSGYSFIDVSDIFRKNAEINSKLLVIVPDWGSVQQVVLPVTSFDYWQLLVIIFWIGVVLMAFRLLTQLISLYKIHRSSTEGILNNYKIRRLNKEITPFSFWQSIYLNPSQHQKEELATILQHEEIHVKEWHTLDVLLAEISVVFYWFNPGVWLMKQAIKENLEFITDRKVLNSGLDSRTYQYSLVRMIFSPQDYSLVNNFSFISIKKRIIMMNKKQSPQVQVSRYLLIVPMVVVLTLVFTISKAQLENKSLHQLKKGGISVIQGAVKSVSSIPAVITEATRMFTTDAQPVKVKIAADIQETSTESQSENEPAGLTIKADQVNTVADTSGHPIMRIRGNHTIIGSDYTPLFVVDGTVTPNALAALNPEDIFSMEVLKDAYALSTIYGGKSPIGVVVITTKAGKNRLFDLVKSGTRPVLVNGKEISKQEIDKLTFDKISGIDIIINKEALIKYGERGVNGALWVAMK